MIKITPIPEPAPQVVPRQLLYLSVAAALTTILVKFTAYVVSNSVGLLTDALESVVNLVAALIALWAVSLANKPEDDQHAYGHSKAEYFASGAEGVLIILAAGGSLYATLDRIFTPHELTDVYLGIVCSTAAAILNGIVAWRLLQAGKQFNSIALRADAHHLFTDMWTSIGVILGLLVVSCTGILWLDPLIAGFISVNIGWTGFLILKESSMGLLDAALPPREQALVREVLQSHESADISFHAVRTRVAGYRRFVSFHVLVPGDWTIQAGHDLCEDIETALLRALPGSKIFTHLEPRDDPRSFHDQALDRSV